MRNNQRGMSLVEVTIILAVLALLTAVAAPAIGGYMQDSAASKAKADVEAIGSALARMLADTSEPWILRDGNGATATDPPSRAAANRVNMLVSPGNTPVRGVARAVNAADSTVDWADPVNDGGVQRLAYFLVSNTPSGLSANSYRSPANMTVLGNYDPDSGSGGNSEFGWRGAYLPGPLGPDPWAYRYAVNVEFLAKALGAGPSGNVNDVFVISAGPNATVETRFDIDGVAAGGDDIIFVLSGGTR
jgi:type II secretory pathway pseudopilin PulG